jgi:predicted short-subunit dehydrogenase-like oxidoreductase (DUF2520 family)
LFKKISIIGSGNVASLISKRLNSSGIEIRNIYSRNISNALSLASYVGAKALKDIKAISQNSDLIIVAVNDDALSIVSEQLGSINCPIVHTSGQIGMEVFQSNSLSFGKMYPLQSITKNTKEEVEIPMCICGNNQLFVQNLHNFSKMFFANSIVIQEEKFQYLHLSAVLVNNFTNALYTQAFEILKEQDMDFEILKPLVNETIQRIGDENPKEMQTGPAIRNDLKTMESHLNLLNKLNKSELVEVYQILSNLITKQK